MGMKKAAGIVLLSTGANVLLCHPTNHSKHFWSIPKGVVDEGETEWQGAIRETLEETGVVVWEAVDHEVLHVGTYPSGNKRLTTFLVMADMLVDDDTEFKCKSFVEAAEWNGYDSFPEVDEWKWFSIDDAIEVVHPTQKDALRTLKLKL